MPNPSANAALLVLDVQPGIVDRIGDRTRVSPARSRRSSTPACPDAEVHRVLLEKVFPRQAEVLTTAPWIATAWRRRRGTVGASDW